MKTIAGALGVDPQPQMKVWQKREQPTMAQVPSAALQQPQGMMPQQQMPIMQGQQPFMYPPQGQMQPIYRQQPSVNNMTQQQRNPSYIQGK